MIKLKVLLFFLISVSFLNLQAQKVNEYSFLGTLHYDNNIISFSIKFTEDDGVIEGISITNIGNNDETVNNIHGLYFKKDKSLQIRESEIQETKSKEDISSFCFVNLNLKFKGLFKNKLEGEFTGYLSDGSQCAHGKVLLYSKKKIEKKMKKLNSVINKRLIDNDIVLLKNEQEITFSWQDDYLTLFIWDSNQEDNDEINLIINDELILEEYQIRNTPKKVRYKLQNGLNTLVISASNLGKFPPNTCNITFIDANQIYPIITELQLNEEITIKISR